uniref:Uncharacterized protein n=1 Tax=Rhodnius prolixus TaxID=13249 RepID=T1HAV5_RHOPR
MDHVARKRSWKHCSEPPQTISKEELHPKKITLSIWCHPLRAVTVRQNN